MITRNENLEIITSAALAQEIVMEGLDVQEAIMEQGAKDALADLYVQAYNLETSRSPLFNKAFEAHSRAITLDAVDKEGLWELVKKTLCRVLEESDLINAIIEVILDVIASVIPLGILIKKLVKIIISYLLKTGIGAVCPAN